MTVGNVLTEEMFENIKKSIELLLKDIVPYGFRTTLVKEFHGIDDVVEIAKAIKGARPYYLQNLEIGVETIGKERFTPVDRETLEEMIKRASKFVKVMKR
ncbi:MAG: hypothetical protein DRN06_05535 [Thermoprotei archaeon]|nr:MAG: hypothetical protein DRN06_05535 [Thermoprotei archaeon]